MTVEARPGAPAGPGAMSGPVSDRPTERLPATPTEKALVRDLAMAQWRLVRLSHMEAAHRARRIDDIEHYAKRDKFNRAPQNALVIDRDYHLLDRSPATKPASSARSTKPCPNSARGGARRRRTASATRRSR